MTVESPLELYLTLFGWRIYEHIWAVLVTTRLLYVPILMMVFTNITVPLMSQEAKSAVVTSVKRMEIQLVLAIVAILLVGVPSLTLNAGVLKYHKACATAFGPAGMFATGATGTTYDEVLADTVVTSVRVPIWWRLWMAITSGVNREVIAGIGCTADFSGYRLRISKQRVTDDGVAAEMQKFVQYCFRPSFAKWLREGRSLQREGLTELSIDDVQWIGSEAFLRTPGFYDTYRAGEGIAGWPYNPARDTDYPPDLVSQYDTANMGRPRCNEWWEDGSKGLRAKLMASFDEGLFTGHFAELATRLGRPIAEVEDDVLKVLVTVSQANAPLGTALVPAYREGRSFSFTDLLAREFAKYGIRLESLSFTPMMYAVRAAVPIIQAFILCGMYMFFGIVLVVAGLNFSSVVTLTIAFFTVKFWSVLWHLAWWLENRFIEVLYPGGWEMAFRFVDAEGELKLQILKFMMLLMYVVLPMLFSFLLSVVGVSAIAGFSAITSATLGPVQAGGRAVADTTVK